MWNQSSLGNFVWSVHLTPRTFFICWPKSLEEAMPVATSSTVSDQPTITSTYRSDEGRHHRETTASVRLKSQRLRRALDSDRLDDAIKIAADIAAELRSPSANELSPKGYYDVYLSVCAELRLLEMYVMESARRGAPVLELYERVQETPLILPRLYLLVTAGSVYAKSLQAPAKDVLRDLVEMCAGVQHPQRGLFLRAYLAQMMKDKLPDTVDDDMNNSLNSNDNTDNTNSNDNEDSTNSNGVEDKSNNSSNLNSTSKTMDNENEERINNLISSVSTSGGTVLDSIEFVIRNFTEMNRLWVRMQHDGSPREMEIREKERLELRLLVGSNVATLSRLVGDNLLLYRENVLPSILEQIVNCKDAIAQEYLADCVAQVFPDEFQLATLESFLSMCASLVKGVNMKTILVSIINRLTKFSSSNVISAQAARSANAFHIFRTELPDVLKRQGNSLSLGDRLTIYLSLMSFALQAEPDRTDYVDDVLGFCVSDMNSIHVNNVSNIPNSNISNDSNGNINNNNNSNNMNLTSHMNISNIDNIDRYQHQRQGLNLGNSLGGSYSSSKVSSLDSRRDNRNNGRAMIKSLDDEDERLTMKVLTMPLEKFNSVGAILKLGNYVILQRFLRYDNQKSLAARLLMSANEYEPCIKDVITLEKLFKFVSPLIKDEDIYDKNENDNIHDEVNGNDNENFDAGSLTHHHEYLISLFPVSHSASSIVRQKEVGSNLIRRNTHIDRSMTSTMDLNGNSNSNNEEVNRDFEMNQELVARIVYLCEGSDIEKAIRLYNSLRQQLLIGGEKRLYYSLPSLVFASLRLALRCGGNGDESKEQVERMLTFAAECIDYLGEGSSLLALRLRLHVAGTASSLSTSLSNSAGRFVYDNIAEAFVAYEQQVTTSREQNLALELIVAQLGSVEGVLDKGSYEALSTRSVKHASRALTRSDQCVLLCRCALLFTSDMNERAMNCIRKAMNAAEWCVSVAERVLLYLDVASTSIRLQEDEICDVFEDAFLTNVLRKIREIVSGRRAKGSALGKVAIGRYQRIINYIRARLHLFEAIDVAEL